MNDKATLFNPFPGLRSFRSDEDHLFFGREEQTLELMARLERNRFITVVGSSGRGKSSLVRCGLLSRLQGGGMAGAGAHWEIAVMQPGGDPLRHLAEALLEAGLYDRAAESAVPQLLATLGRSQFGLVQAVRQAALPAGTNFLLVVDQFEEIFRYDEAGAVESELANDFIAMLREACAQTDVAIYVVATMRSDFIGDCSRFEGLAEAVNRGEYLIPRLSREQFKSAIEGPIRVAGGRIAPRLLQRLLNDVGEEQDQLPCLQHALMRTWRVWQGRAGAEALDLEDYAQVGKMSQALSLHADEVYSSLATDRQRELCAAMFKALTVEGSEKRGIRRPRRLHALCRILAVEKAELVPVIDAFRQPEVSFLVPPADVELRDSTVIDLSHESLMRVWTRLCGWVGEEAQSVGIFRRLSESAALWRQGRTALCRDPELSIARAWLQTNRPNAAWAEQYGGSFDEAMTYLQSSTEVVEAEIREREERARAGAARKTRRMRWLIGGLATAVVVLCIAGVFGLRQRRLEFERISRTDVGTASRLIDEGRTTDGLAHLLRAARRDPHNPAIAPRLASLLTSRNFLLPEGAAVTHPSPVLWSAFSEDGKSIGVLWKDGAYGRIDLATGGIERSQLPSPLVNGQPLIPTRRFLLVRCQDGVIRILDHAGQLTREIRFEQRMIGLPRGDSRRGVSGDLFVASLANQTIVLCDAATGRTLGAPIPAGKIGYLILGEKWLLWGDKSGLGARTLSTEAHLRDTETGSTEITLRAPFGAFDWLTSPTGRQAAVVQRESEDNPLFLRLYSLPDGAPLAPAQRIENAVFPGVGGWPFYSPDGRLIVTWYAVLEVWNAQTGARLARIPAAGLYSGDKLAFSPDNQTLATWSSIGSLELWDLATGNARVPALKHGGNVNSASFSADGSVLLTTATDGFVRVWDVATGQLLAEPTLQQRTTPVVAISPDRTQVMIGTREGALYRFRIGQGRARSVALPRTRPLMPAPFLPASPSRLLWMLGDRARVLDAASGREVAGGFAYPEPIRAMGVRFTGPKVRQDFKVMVVQTVPGPWQAWWLGDGKIEKVVTLAEAPDDSRSGVNVAFSAAGDRVVLAWPRTFTLRVWDLRTGQPVGPAIATSAGTALTPRVNLSPDGTRVTVGVNAIAGLADGVGRVWDAATGKEVFRFEGQGTFMPAILFSPDGSRIATTNNQGEAQFWDGRTGEAVGSVLFHSAAVTGAEFAPDGNLLTHSADGEMRLWDRNTSTPIGEPMPLGLATITSAKFSPDGLRVVTASIDGTARLWDVRSALPATEPLMQGKAIVLAEFSPDGRFVRTETTDNVYHLWSVPPPLPAGEKTPEWLLDLAAICAGKTLNAEGRFITSADAFGKIDDVRQTLDDLPDDAPYVEWGRWFLADRATRSIAPGFTITPAEAEKLAKEMAPPPAAPATPVP